MNMTKMKNWNASPKEVVAEKPTADKNRLQLNSYKRKRNENYFTFFLYTLSRHWP